MTLYPSLPAGTVWVVKTVSRRICASACSNEAPLLARACPLEAAQRRVALVQMDQNRVDAERLQRAHAADAEHRVLRQPHVPVADVQTGGDPAVDRVVLGAIGVEQEQRHPAEVDAPDVAADDAFTIESTVSKRWSAPVTRTAGKRSKSASVQYSRCQPSRSSCWWK
jgi:hypothetical protein